MKKDYKKEQEEAREASKPKLAEGYKYNALPNRRTRRAQARSHNRNAWGEANRQWSDQNKQTVKKDSK